MQLYTFNDGTVITLKYVVVVEPVEDDDCFTVRMLDGTYVVAKNSSLERCTQNH